MPPSDGTVKVAKIFVHPIKVSVVLPYLSETNSYVCPQSCRGTSVEAVKYTKQGLEVCRATRFFEAFR